MIGHRSLARSLALGGYFGLLGLWIAWATVWAPLRHPPTALVLAASTLPLLPCLRGLLHDRSSAYFWLGLLSLIYFIHGVGAAMAESTERVPAALEALFGLVLFGGCFLRLRPVKSRVATPVPGDTDA